MQEPYPNANTVLEHTFVGEFKGGIPGKGQN
jgi:hypothetical protein